MWTKLTPETPKLPWLTQLSVISPEHSPATSEPITMHSALSFPGSGVTIARPTRAAAKRPSYYPQQQPGFLRTSSAGRRDSGDTLPATVCRFKVSSRLKWLNQGEGRGGLLGQLLPDPSLRKPTIHYPLRDAGYYFSP